MLLLAGHALILPRIPQPLYYHDFADQRACLGLPNCLDTASNALFVLLGAVGLRFLYGVMGRTVFIDAREARPYVLFFVAVILVGFGSGFYHLAPTMHVWPGIGRRLLPWLAIAGLGSVAYWSFSEAHGMGDLRPYGLMQLIPLLPIPLLLGLYRARYSGDQHILAVIGLYLLALLCDFSDCPIFALNGGLVGGHTAKHVIVALAAYWVVLHLRRRLQHETARRPGSFAR